MKPTKVSIKVEDYKGIPMLVLYYGPGLTYNLRLTQKKIELLESNMPLARAFSKAVKEKTLESFKKELEMLGHPQPKIVPVDYAKSETEIMNGSKKTIAPRKDLKPVVDDTKVTFK